MSGKLTAFIIAALFACCARAEKPITVTVSIPPQAYIVERVGDKLVSTNVLVPDGRSPHDYAPRPSQLIQLSESAMFLTIGMPFEQQMINKLRSQTSCAFVDMTSGIKFMMMEEPCHSCKDHKHEHIGPDPHVWMCPRNLRIMAANTLDALKTRLPEKHELLEQNFRKLDRELQELDLRLSTSLAPFKGNTVFVFHPALGYFTANYGLKQRAIEVGGKDPTPRRLMELIELAKKEKAKVIFVQPQFNTNAAHTMAKAIGGVVDHVNVLEKDVISLLSRLGDDIVQALTPEKRN